MIKSGRQSPDSRQRSAACGSDLFVLVFPLVACLCLVVVLLVSGCGPAPRLQSAYSDFNNPLQVYLTAQPDTNGVLQPAVEVTVPRRALIFQQQDDRITGGLRVTVVARRDGRQIGGAVRSRKLVPVDWAATASDSLVVCTVPLALTDTGAVDLHVRASSLGTQRTWSRRLRYLPGQLEDLPYAFADFAWNLGSDGWIAADIDTLRLSVTVVPVGAVSEPGRDAGGAAGTSIGDATSGGTDPSQPVHLARLGVRLLGVEAFSTVQEQTIAETSAASGSATTVFAFAAAELPFGRLRIEPYLAVGPPSSRIVRNWSPARWVRNFHVNVDDEQTWRRQVAWLEGKFSSDHVKALTETPPPRRPAWELFWRDADTGPGLTPTTTDPLSRHLDLILSADEQFAGGQRGGLTDRGRAWIRYGPPDEVDRLGEGQAGQNRWEVWHFWRLGLRLTFLDTHGLGDYRLLETAHVG